MIRDEHVLCKHTTKKELLKILYFCFCSYVKYIYNKNPKTKDMFSLVSNCQQSFSAFIIQVFRVSVLRCCPGFYLIHFGRIYFSWLGRIKAILFYSKPQQANQTSKFNLLVRLTVAEKWPPLPQVPTIKEETDSVMCLLTLATIS